MSRVGKAPVEIPSGVEVTLGDAEVRVKGPKGTLAQPLLIWLVIGVVLSETGTLPIGNWAHGGGGAWGVAAGLASRSRHRVLWLAVLGLATAGLLAWVMAGKVYW